MRHENPESGTYSRPDILNWTQNTEELPRKPGTFNLYMLPLSLM